MLPTLKVGESEMLKPPYPYRSVGFLPLGLSPFLWVMNMGSFTPSLLVTHTCRVSKSSGWNATLGCFHRVLAPVLKS